MLAFSALYICLSGFSYTSCSVGEKTIISYGFIHVLFPPGRELCECPPSISASPVLPLRQVLGQNLETAAYEESDFPQIRAGAKCLRLTSAEQGRSYKSTLMMERLKMMRFHKYQECLASGQLGRSNAHQGLEHMLAMKSAKMRKKEKDSL